MSLLTAPRSYALGMRVPAETTAPARDAACAGDHGPCGAGPDAELTLLVRRAAQGVQGVLDRAARAHGLTDARDWLVLTALSDGARRTHLEIAATVGIDKTTLTAVLDRLEEVGMVVRRPHPADRRARIPEWTEAGRTAWSAVGRTRDQWEAHVLGDVQAEQQHELRELLHRMAGSLPPTC